LVDTYNNTIAPILGGNSQAGSLNTLAQTFASNVNTLLSSGTTSSGAPGVPIFTYSSNTSNVARTLAVDPSVTPAQVAVATTGASSEANGVANQLAALSSSSNQIDGLSIQDYYASIAQSVGQQLSDATAQSTGDQTSLTAAQANQTSSEGVSLDQEAINVTADQRAYEAVAKLASVMDNMTLDAVNLVGEQDS
jgi:flagellar hook-associated protein 1 FlgK